MKRWKKLPIVLAGIGTAILLGAVVYGYWKQSGRALNILTVGSFQNQIVEKYIVPGNVKPGDEVDKIVNVSNTGNVDSLIRVSIKKEFGTTSSDGSFHPEAALDPEVIEIQCANTWWLAEKDGYYYYKEILKPGKTTKEPLFQSYRLSENAGNEYKGKEAHIVVELESMQADMDPEKVWGITAKDLGITLQKGSDGADTKVVYKGRNGGFLISESTTDLFASFKNLLPGCTRTQNIQIENRSQEKVEMFLHAEEADLSESTKREQIQKLLNHDAMISIRQGSRILYRGPVSGNASAGNAGMKQDISLGFFQANEKKDLLVSLEMDPDMDTDMGNLSAKVRWVFTTKGEDGTTLSTQSISQFPRTGDTTAIHWYLMMAAGSGLLGMVLCLDRKKRRKE